MYTLQFDGLFRKIFLPVSGGGQAGLMTYGWLVTHSGRIVARGHGVYLHPQDATSNVAEYLALIEGLEALQCLDVRGKVEVRGDAKSVIDQMLGHAAVNTNRVKPLFRRARKLAAGFAPVVWTWTPRKNNALADALTRRAIRQINRCPDDYATALAHMPRAGARKAGTGYVPVMDVWMMQPGGEIALP
jgi:ribonuclease HI